jgi:TP901 family phage tail tape measure protein
MQNDLKRVGLVFKADGEVDFRKSLQNVNAELSKNRAEFQLLQAQYDSGTKASQKLADRQEYLSKQYATQEDRVSVLRKELEEMEKTEGTNTKALEKKRTQLNNAEASMIKYGKELKEVNAEVKRGTADLEAYAKKLKDKGDQMKSFGTSLTKNVTAPIIGLGVGAVASFRDIDKAYDGIIKKTGATGKTLDKLTDSFDKIYGNFPFTSDQVSDAIGGLNTRFGFLDEQLEKATEDFLKFADINNTDVSSAIQLVSRAMGDAGIPAEEYGSLLDVLTTASQKSGIEISRLTDLITKYGAPMRALGLDTKESIAIFSQWEKAGVNTEIAFSGMKQAIGRWGKEGKDAREEFSKTLKLIGDAPNIADATALAIEIFGQKAGPDLADAIQGGRFEYEEFLALLEESTDVVANTFDATQTPLDEAQVAWNNLKLVMADLGKTIMETLAPIIKDLSRRLKELKSWFDGLSEEQKQTIIVVAGLIAAIGPLLVILGTIAGAISNLISLFIILKPLFLALTGPIGLIVLAIIALIVAVVTIIKHWDTVKEVAIACWETIKNAWKSVATWFSDKVIKPVVNAFDSMVKGIKYGFDLTWWGIQVGVISMANLVIGVINTMVKGALAPLNLLIEGLNKIPGVNIKKISYSIDKITLPPMPKLAKGGELLSGMAMIAEAGPELLLQQGNKTKVMPLSSGGGATPTEIIDYEEITRAFIRALSNSKLMLDEDGFVRIVKEELLRVV